MGNQHTYTYDRGRKACAECYRQEELEHRRVAGGCEEREVTNPEATRESEPQVCQNS